MKIQHLEYAIEIERLGSLSKAAEHFMLSQPNISSALRTIENELGFQIFNRTNRGVEVTSKGKKFLAFARSVTKDYKALLSQVNELNYHKIGISAGYHYAIEEAFVNMCALLPSSDLINLSLTNTNPDDIVEDVYQNRSDIGVLIVPERGMESFDLICQKKELRVQKIQKLNYYVHLKSDHPLLLDDSNFDLSLLPNYPCVDYARNVTTTGMDAEYVEIFDPEKCIHVDDRDTRYNIVSKSDAFTIGCCIHPNIVHRYNIASIQIPNAYYYMVCIQNNNHINSPEEKLFFKFLKQSIANSI